MSDLASVSGWYQGFTELAVPCYIQHCEKYLGFGFESNSSLLIPTFHIFAVLQGGLNPWPCTCLASNLLLGYTSRHCLIFPSSWSLVESVTKCPISKVGKPKQVR